MSKFENHNYRPIYHFMKPYKTLIRDECKTEKTRELVSRAIPILVRWAQNGITNNTYKDLIKELGMVRFSGIGYTLGKIEDVLESLREKTGKRIPTLNALVKGKDGMPSYGFDYVKEHYSDMPDLDKQRFIDGINNEAIKYPHWDAVLQVLCLKPSVVDTFKDEKSIRSGKHYGTGEGPQHKALKEYIYAHPEIVGLEDISCKSMEYILLSGDRLDIYFEQKDGTRIAVEVKSIVSPDDDILRGLYQCVKYKAVLDAENKTHGLFSNTRSLLVIEGSLSESNQQVKDSLGIKVIECFSKK